MVPPSSHLILRAQTMTLLLSEVDIHGHADPHSTPPLLFRPLRRFGSIHAFPRQMQRPNCGPYYPTASLLHRAGQSPGRWVGCPSPGRIQVAYGVGVLGVDGGSSLPM